MATVSLHEALEALRQEITQTPIDSEAAAEAFRIRFLGQRSGQLTHLFKRLRELPPEERPLLGGQLNALKRLAEQRLEEARLRLRPTPTGSAEIPDLTLPGRRMFTGSLHPLTQTLEAIVRVFEQLGFAVVEGPEIEDDWHNFSALNFPPDHPARDMQDTFFLHQGASYAEAVVLRTHTSPVQIRVMERMQPPIRIIAPGRVYRNEAVSYKSFCLFHQVEGLYVDQNVSMGDLKQTLHLFAQALFGKDVRMRFRPSYFPFTEPSAEVDIWWPLPDHPEGGRWMEILGCGMVHPNVFRAVGIDPERYTGYAFGMGVERIAMLRYGIDDIRLFYENDVRFLEQF
ncbi:phenylalanine--tRNA ligase subunit alpha [Rhodothermus bifroesti]|uniref:Phenylalanine--tRNA ligase alpha subunit n=1 Tax=Rhodothermus marinus TaxID=29549 RepID=A0A7V2F587_RHOMR|nr:phenylalanine--tRNA ligase subunit alpha [Rhodothermus bifroesti]